jgi:four helix bundle protein
VTDSELKDRTKDFALRVVRLVESLPRGITADVMGRQLLRAATSVAANYRAACRGKRRADFIAKMGIVEEEADECALWLELIAASALLPTGKIAALQTEASALTAIAVKSIRTARTRLSNPQSATRNPQSP